jgi:hypothetical protein
MTTNAENPPATESVEPSFLNGEEVFFARPSADGPLRVTLAENYSLTDAEMVRCFPMTDPERWIEIRERNGKTLGILRDLTKLEKDQHRLVVEALNARYILPRILRIIQLYDKFHCFHWVVETDRGPREFRMGPPRECLRRRGAECWEISDQTGCRYEIQDLSRMDTHSRALFEQVR